MLMVALGEADYWDLAEQDIGHLPDPPDDSPAVYGLPDRLVLALAALPEERLEAVAQRWSRIQDVWTLCESHPARFISILRDLRRVAQQASGQGSKLLLRVCE